MAAADNRFRCLSLISLEHTYMKKVIFVTVIFGNIFPNKLFVKENIFFLKFFSSTCLSNIKIHEAEYFHPFEGAFRGYFFGGYIDSFIISLESLESIIRWSLSWARSGSRNPVISVCSGCRIRSGMSNLEFFTI